MTDPATKAMAHALAYRECMATTAPGRAQADLRMRIAEAGVGNEAQVLAVAEMERLRGLGIEDMPPSTDDVSLLLDALTFRLGATARAEAWRSIGVNPNRGRDMLARNAAAVDWPIWFTLRDAAIK